MEDELAIISRFALIIVYLFMFVFFTRNYRKSKESGFVNKFFLGYAVFFFALFCVQIGLSMDALFSYLGIPGTGWIRADFPGADDPANVAKVAVLSNMVLPIYILGLAALLCLLAAQIYPLEQTLNWRRAPGTIFLVCVSGGLMLVFIPALTWSTFTLVMMFASIAGMLYGLIINVGVNIKLAAVSTGDLRRRSVSIIFASILFYLGFIYTLEIGEISLRVITGISGLSLKWDIIFGCALQMVSALLYWNGLRVRN